MEALVVPLAVEARSHGLRERTLPLELQNYKIGPTDRTRTCINLLRRQGRESNSGHGGLAQGGREYLRFSNRVFPAFPPATTTPRIVWWSPPDSNRACTSYEDAALTVYAKGLNLVLPDGIEPPYPVLQTVANPSQLKKLGTGSETRTHTEQVLNLLPLPIGLHRHF